MVKNRVILTFMLILVILLPMVTPVVRSDAIIEVTIGGIAASTLNVPSFQTIADIAMEDINAAMISEGSPYRFKVEIKDAFGDPQNHLNEVIDFNNAGINIICGGEWSGQAAASLDYINSNGVLLLSHSSTGPNLQIAGDNLFRLCPSDSYMGPSIAHMVLSYGYRYAIIIQRGDSWGDGLADVFKTEYTKIGGKTLGDSTTRYDPEATDFTGVLSAAERQMCSAQMRYGPNKTCILLISYNESSQILAQVNNYPRIYATKWFGSDGTANAWNLHDDVPDQACHLKVFSTSPVTINGAKYDEVDSRYFTVMQQPLGSYGAYAYDIYWILARSIIATNYVQGAPIDNVKNILPTIAAGYDGISGNCALNQYGDRPSQGFDIWGFGASGGQCQMKIYGFINPSFQVTWEPSAFDHFRIGTANGAITRYTNAYSSNIINGNWALSVDRMGAEFTLNYQERNLMPKIENSPRGSIDYFYCDSRLERVVSQTSTRTIIECSLHFKKNWVKMDGTREWVESECLATITVSRYGLTIDLPTPILGQNFDIQGSTYRYSFS